jgi:hypothetical protein
MKRFVILLMITGLVAGSVATAEAKKKKPKPYVRVVEGTYTNPAPGIGGVVTHNGQGGQLQVPTAAREYYMSVEVTDDSGQASYFGIAADGSIIGGGCGKTETPFEITPGTAYNITVTMGPGLEAPSCVGIATSGTIKVTLTEVP